MFKYRLWLLTALIMLATSVAWAGQKACTMLWCQEGFNANFKGNDWPAGEYHFTITMDSQQIKCKGSLPLKSCDKPNVECDSDIVTIGESGCALPDGHSFSGITSKTIPKHFSLIMTQETGKSFSFDNDVARQCSYPNGKQCDAHQCCSASLDINIAWQ